ncbi:hypothetical protein, partial [Cochleicola gelatinilyticus]|uniref:hypothetical protein n=1 Tax=Cochleicola gelatinilyticus TaxID=1763537 RepID=UPI0018D3BCB4
LLEVVESPEITTLIAPLVFCDTNDDGIAVFDLTQVETVLLNGLDPALYQVNYYDDPSQSIAITNPTAYPNQSNPQTIYVVVT